MDKILVLHSGGLDSTVLLYKAIRDVNYHTDNVKALNIIYGQKHEKEREYAEWTCNHLGVEQLNADLTDVFKYNPNSSTLLKDSEQEIEHSSYAQQVSSSDGRPVATYIPYRNGLFLSYAASVAYQLGCNKIYYGAHRDDAAGAAYPDCTEAFIWAQTNAIWLGSGEQIRMESPWAKMNKTEIVHNGLMLGMSEEEFEHTWSCYEGGDTPCGTCGTCIDRKKAFEANHLHIN